MINTCNIIYLLMAMHADKASFSLKQHGFMNLPTFCNYPHSDKKKSHFLKERSK